MRFRPWRKLTRKDILPLSLLAVLVAFALLYRPYLRPLLFPGLYQPDIVQDPAYEEGGNKALEDLQRGEYRLIQFGLPTCEAFLKCKRIRSTYGIEVVSYCVLEDSFWRYSQGYNKVMEAAIRDKFGPNVLREIRGEIPIPQGTPSSPAS